MFKTFGAGCVDREFLPRMVPAEDEEISKELTRLFQEAPAIDVNTGAKVEDRREDGNRRQGDLYRCERKIPVVKEAEKVLVAVGRAPRTADIGVDKTKIELDRGFVKVDGAQETAEPGVFAIGDMWPDCPSLHMWAA